METTTTQPSSANPTEGVTAPPFSRSRSAVTTCVTGLRLTRVLSQCGSVSAGTNALDTNVSGSRTMIDNDVTDCALLAIVPMYMKIHEIGRASCRERV